MNLHIQSLSKRYGDTPVFANVSLTVEPGEFVAIVGESGVGKSTLLNCMAGLDSWDSGTVHLDGTNIGQLTDDARALLRRQKVGFVFQAFHVLGHLDVTQNVVLPLLLLGTPDDARVQAMLQAVGLEGMGARLPQQLSGGQLWPLPAPWCTARPCCWPTSPPATWTPPPPRRSWRPWWHRPAHTARRWSWSPTPKPPRHGRTGYCICGWTALPHPPNPLAPETPRRKNHERPVHSQPSA